MWDDHGKTKRKLDKHTIYHTKFTSHFNGITNVASGVGENRKAHYKFNIPFKMYQILKILWEWESETHIENVHNIPFKIHNILRRLRM